MNTLPLLLAQVQTQNTGGELNFIFAIPVLLAWVIIIIQTIQLLGSLRHLVNAARHFLEEKTPPPIKH